MKTRPNKLLTVMLCLVLSAVWCMPAFAVISGDIEAEAMEKLEAFWNQPAYDGMNNGNAVLDHNWIEGAFYGCGNPPDPYTGGWQNLLVERQYGLVGTQAVYRGYAFNFVGLAWYTATFEFEDSEYPISVEGDDEITPDLYGPLDLSYTSLCEVGEPYAGQTHISSVNFDGCDELHVIKFRGQMYCKEFSAVDCTDLRTINLTDGVFEKIDVTPSGFDTSVSLRSFGSGYVGMTYSNSGVATLKATPAEGSSFLGWFLDGERVSTSRTYNVTDGGIYVACFTGETGEFGIRPGDINGDGELGFTDVSALYAYVLGAGYNRLPAALADVDRDGEASFADVGMLYAMIIG